jgi:hypothetical protein
MEMIGFMLDVHKQKELDEKVKENQRRYRDLVENLKEQTITQQHAVIEGQRRLLEIQEIPIPKKGSIGFARDITELEQWEGDRQRHDQAQREILENLSTIDISSNKLTSFDFTQLQRCSKLRKVFLDNHCVVRVEQRCRIDCQVEFHWRRLDGSFDTYPCIGQLGLVHTELIGCSGVKNELLIELRHQGVEL